MIIKTYNSSDVIEECIKRVFEKNKKRSFEIIVIDNHSKDETAEKVRSAFPQSQVRVIKNNINIGFARAVNLGVKLAKGKYILLLYPDTLILSEEPIEEMISFLEKHPRVAAVGALWAREEIIKKFYEELKSHPLTLINSGLLPQQLQRLWLFTFEILTRDIAILLFKLIRGEFASFPGHFNEPIYVYFIGGYCLFTTKNLLIELPFDGRFFLYYEDNDWGERVRMKGKMLCILPWVKVLHIWGHSSRGLSQRPWKTVPYICIYRWLLKRNLLLGVIYRLHLLGFRIPLYCLKGLSYLLCGNKTEAFLFLKEAIDLFLLRYPYPV